MDDRQIIALLFARDEDSLKIIEKQYGQLYKSILRQAISDPSDIDECGNDVLLALWNSIPPHVPNHFPSYICSIARRIGINRFKHNTRRKRNNPCTVLLSELAACIPASDQLESRQEAQQLRQVLNAFLQDLDPQTRVLFIRRYYYLEPVKDIAARFDVSTNFVSVRLHRARAALKKLLKKEGISL